MVICGLQKLTLLDYPGLVACTVFTRGCNYACHYCQNSSLVISNKFASVIPEKEVKDFLASRVNKLDGVCISGGEPSLQKDLEQFASYCKSLGFKVKLDTNGSSPSTIKKLVEAGLVDYIAMDIKNSLDKYPSTVNSVVDINKVKESIDYLINQTKIDYEFRTTCIKEHHCEDDFEKISKMLKGAKVLYLQNFILSDGVIDKSLHGFSKEELCKFQAIVRAHQIKCELRGID